MVIVFISQDFGPAYARPYRRIDRKTKRFDMNPLPKFRYPSGSYTVGATMRYNDIYCMRR